MSLFREQWANVWPNGIGGGWDSRVAADDAARRLIDDRLGVLHIHVDGTVEMEDVSTEQREATT